jgi:class 3 adenylate cyclase
LHVIAMMNASFGAGFDESLEAARQEARLAESDRVAHSLEQTAGFVSLWCGDLATSRRCFERSLSLGERVSPHDGYTTAGYMWLLSLTGRYEEIGELLERTRADSGLSTQIVAMTALYEMAERQASPEAAQMLEDLWQTSLKSGESQRSVPALSARARWRLIDEGVDASSADFWHVLDATVSARGRGSHWLFSPDFAMALTEQERPEELSRWADEIAIVTNNDHHPHNRAANALVQGCRWLAFDQFEVAREQLQQARQLYGEMGCPARLAETHLVLASVAARLGESELTREQLDLAIETADAIGAQAVVARARRLEERSSGESVLATILFTDIVDSTLRAHEIGDVAWRSLLGRHDDVVRREFERFRGREVNTTGDGFVAAFETASQAVRCATAIRDGLDSVGTAIRIGLHTGECQVVGSDLRGVAVHLAARVCASGGAGEIRLTSTVKDLLSGMGFTFNDVGPVELKGFVDSWHLYSL